MLRPSCMTAALAAALLSISVATTRAATIEDNESTGFDSSIAVDSAGTIHLAYYDRGADMLRYARRVGSTWSFEDVWSNPTGRQTGFTSPRLALGALGVETMTFYDTRDHICWWAHRHPTLGWQPQQVHLIPDNGNYHWPSVTKAGNPTVALYESNRHRVYYAYLNEFGLFARDTVDQNGDAGFFVSLDHDADDLPHMLYFADVPTTLDYELRYAHFTTSWQVTTLADSAHRGPTAIKVDHDDGTIHIAYANTRHVIHGISSGTAWTFDTLATFANPVNHFVYVSLALDTSDPLGHAVPIIAYSDPDARTSMLARGVGAGTWSIEPIDSQVENEDCSVAVALDGTLSVGYRFNGGPSPGRGNDLRYATSSGAGWTKATLDGDENDDFGRSASTARDSLGNTYYAYYDASNRWLRYSKSGALPTFAYVDRTTDAGSFTDIALARTFPGTACIAYYDATAGDLRVAVGSGTSWTRYLADGSADDVGRYCRIATDVLDTMHVAYYDATNGDLKYAHRKINGAPFVNERVDSLGVVGQYPSIAWSPDNQVCIAYYDSTNGDLKYACKFPVVGWFVFDPAVADDDVGQYASLAFDGNAVAHIAAFDATNQDLLYVRGQPGSWTVERADTVGDVGRFCSMAVSAAGDVSIGYYDSTAQHVKLAWRVNGQWVQRYPVLASGRYGWYTSTRRLAGGVTTMVYYDMDQRDLMSTGGNNPTDVGDATTSPLNLSVWPNPSVGLFIVGGRGWPLGTDVEVKLIDVSGRQQGKTVVRVGPDGVWQLPLTGLSRKRTVAPGLYFVYAQSGASSAHRRVVVLR